MLSLILQVLISISGVWNAWDYTTIDWEELAPLLSENGYDTVFYCAAYGLLSDIDGLNECINACNEYGIDVHAWVVMWKTTISSDEERQILAEDERLQVATDDDTRAQSWLCPTNSENVAEMASMCLRIAGSSNVRGVHLDYIRYSSNRVCFCEGCRSRFQYDTGIYGINWPEDCAAGGRLYQRYNQWRSEAITSAVSSVRDSLNRLNKVVELSAAVLPREREMDYFAQQWDSWLASGLVDFVVPMNYTLSDSELVYWGESQLRLAGRSSIPCGLITSKNDYQFTEDEIQHQQHLAIEMGFDGWVMFHLSRNFVSMLKSNVGL